MTFQCCENNLLCVSCIFSLCSRVKLLLFIISLTVHRKTNFLVNVYWDIKYSDSDSDKRNSPVKYMPHLQMEWNPPKFKILGIWFTNDLKEYEVLNFSEKFLEIRALYKVWLKRQITPLGRVAVLKSLILRLFTYGCYCQTHQKNL